MIDLKQRVQLRQEGARIANILIALHKMFPHMRGLLRVYQYQRQLEATRKEAEEKRRAAIASVKTEVLPKMPVKHISAKVLLLGEDVAQVAAEEERERNTDPVHESANTTRKLSAEWGIVTEQRAAVKVEDER